MTLALALLAGCWPWIEGSWSDYAVPDAMRAAGIVSWTTYQGDYWVDSTPTGLAYWGWLATPAQGRSGFDLGYAQEGACVLNGGDTDWYFNGAEAVDEKDSQLLGDTEIDLGFNQSYGLFVAQPDVEPTGAYGLEPFHVGGTTYAATDAAVMPPHIAFDMNAFAGSSPPTVPASDITTFDWTVPDETDGVTVVASVYIMKDNGAIDSYLSCGAAADAGTITMDFTQLSGISKASYVVIDLAAARETGVWLDGSDDASVHFMSTWAIDGAAYIQ